MLARLPRPRRILPNAPILAALAANAGSMTTLLLEGPFNRRLRELRWGNFRSTLHLNRPYLPVARTYIDMLFM